MKTRYLRYRSVSLLLLLVAGAVSAYRPVWADDVPAQVEPAVIQITMPARANVFMQDQPLVLHYDVYNPASVPVFFSGEGPLGTDNWVQIALLDDKGRPMPQQQNPPGISRNDLQLSSFRVDPNDHTTGTIIPSRWFKTPKLGRYTLVIVSEQSVFRFPVTFIADDHGKLKAMVKQLGMQALQTDDLHTRQSLIQAVCVLPVSDALTVWQQILNAPDCRAMIARELARKPSNVSADILAKSAWSDDLEERVDSGRLLDTMYNEGTPGLRAHIKMIYAQHGVAQLPDKLSPPADDN